MKFAWRNNIPNLATLNLADLEEVDLGEFQELLAADTLNLHKPLKHH